MADHEDPTEAAPNGRHPSRDWEALMAQHARGRSLKVRPATPRDHGRIDVIVRARFPRPAAVLGEAAGIARRRIGIAGPDGRTHSAWLAEDAHGVPRAYLIVSSDDRGDLHIHEVASAPPGPAAAPVTPPRCSSAPCSPRPWPRRRKRGYRSFRWPSIVGLPGDAALVPPGAILWRTMRRSGFRDSRPEMSALPSARHPSRRHRHVGAGRSFAGRNRPPVASSSRAVVGWRRLDRRRVRGMHGADVDIPFLCIYRHSATGVHFHGSDGKAVEDIWSVPGDGYREHHSQEEESKSEYGRLDIAPNGRLHGTMCVRAEDPWRATGDAGTIKTGSKNAMRLDVQPSESGWSNTAIQNNIQPKTASNSYSSVSVTDACFTAETYRKGSNLGRALQYAHQQSLANRTIFEITLVQVASKVAPKARTINCTSTDNCKGKISVPATMKPGASLMCPKCFQYQKV